MASDMYRVQRSTTIAASPEEVIEEVLDFRRWQAWSPWEGLDAKLQRQYAGVERGVGAHYAWSGNRKAGRGNMSITGVDEPRRVTIAVQFEAPFPSTSTSVFTFEPFAGGTRATWTMTGATTRFSRLMGLFVSMDKLIGPDFAKGLAALKAVVEGAAGSAP